MSRKATDETIMPFGKHRGKMLGTVPASYLLWFLDQGGASFPDIRKYIKDHREQLEQEADEEDSFYD